MKTLFNALKKHYILERHISEKLGISASGYNRVKHTKRWSGLSQKIRKALLDLRSEVKSIDERIINLSTGKIGEKYKLPKKTIANKINQNYELEPIRKPSCHYYDHCLDRALMLNKKELPCYICKKYKRKEPEYNLSTNTDYHPDNDYKRPIIRYSR